MRRESRQDPAAESSVNSEEAPQARPVDCGFRRGAARIEARALTSPGRDSGVGGTLPPALQDINDEWS